MLQDVNSGSLRQLLKHMLRVSAYSFSSKSFDGTESFGPELRHVIVLVGCDGTLNI